MKKLLSVSVIAAMAVLPLAANAQGDRAEALTLGLPTATGGTATNLATTSYVQGAYNATKDMVNALITDTDVAEDGFYIKAGNKVASNLDILDTQVKTNANAISNEATTRANAVAGVQTTINNEIERATQAEEAITARLDTLQGSGAGSVAGEKTRAETEEARLQGEIDTINSREIPVVTTWGGDATVTTIKISELGPVE